MTMRLTEAAIDKIKIPAVRRKLANVLEITDQTVIRHIKENKDNGELTKAAALKVISEETGLVEQQILSEESKTTVDLT